MNILYLAQRLPYPPNRGDKIASYNAIRHLARSHSVAVAALASSPEEAGLASKLEELGVDTRVARRSAFASKGAALRAIVDGRPLSIAYYRSRALALEVRRLARERRFDVVLAFSSSMGQYAELVPDVPWVADFVDLDSRKWALYATHARWPAAWVYAMEAKRLLEYERGLARRAARTIVRTRAELRDCEELIPNGRFEVVANGVDLEYFCPRGPKAAGREIVFTGVMDYFPNVQGVQYFCDKVLPLVRRRVPDATFTIVGANPARSVKRLGERPGVRVTGRVPDVRPYVEAAAVAVAPLLMARGIQNKVLEAMAMETPVVAAPAALRGVDAEEGEGVISASTPEEYADRIVALLSDPALARDVASRGRRRVEASYSWEGQLAALESILEDVVRERADLGSQTAARRVETGS